MPIPSEQPLTSVNMFSESWASFPEQVPCYSIWSALTFIVVGGDKSEEDIGGQWIGTVYGVDPGAGEFRSVIVSSRL